MNKTIFIAVFLLAALLLGGVYYLNAKPAVGLADASAPIPAKEEVQPEALSDEQLAAALAERVVGDVNAPVRISEHASFTCGHCAHFHKDSFAAVKEALIDTGKAYLVFSDFPLNAPALHASMIARCLPQDKYFDFVSMLFKEQESWAFEQDYIKFLQAKANEYGMDTPTIKACLGSKKLQEGILQRMTASRTQWNIDSTPSFVVNNKTVIKGALPAEEFIKQVNEAAAASP